MDLTRRALGLGALGLTLAACGGRSAPHAPPLTKLVQVRSGTARRVALGGLAPGELADAQRAFGVDLLGKVCKAGANTTISPASAAISLGLLDAGARGVTEKQISEMLHLPRWGDDVLAAYAAQHARLASIRGQLQLSNRVYSADGSTPSARTLDDWATGFAAFLTQLDIAGHPKEATDRINADVSADTQGLIPKLFDEPLPDVITVVLTNALHLKADWVEPFLPASEEPFTTEAGAVVRVPMMRGQSGSYRVSGGWQSVSLGYQGGHLEMVAILPPQGDGCGDLTASRLTALSRGSADGSGELAMPRIDLSQTHDLLDRLIQLGLPLHGDYAGLGDVDTLDQVVQKVVLKVDEKGTEAAAATGVTGYPTSAHVSQHTIVLDRPYYLLLQDVEIGTPLFLSRVVDPRA